MKAGTTTVRLPQSIPQPLHGVKQPWNDPPPHTPHGYPTAGRIRRGAYPACRGSSRERMQALPFLLHPLSPQVWQHHPAIQPRGSAWLSLPHSAELGPIQGAVHHDSTTPTTQRPAVRQQPLPPTSCATPCCTLPSPSTATCLSTTRRGPRAAESCIATALPLT